MTFIKHRFLTKIAIFKCKVQYYIFCVGILKTKMYHFDTKQCAKKYNKQKMYALQIYSAISTIRPIIFFYNTISYLNNILEEKNIKITVYIQFGHAKGSLYYSGLEQNDQQTSFDLEGLSIARRSCEEARRQINLESYFLAHDITQKIVTLLHFKKIV